MRKTRWFPIAVIVLLCWFPGCKRSDKQAGVQIMEIKENWLFQQKSEEGKENEEKWLPATVPGSVHTDLLANGLIEDPFYRDNENKVQWIEEKDWEYKTTFTVDKKLLEKQHIALVFHGLDTYAKIFLNDRLILQTDNMFRRWQVEVKPFLDEGDNHLYIHFMSPVQHVKAFWEGLGYELPGGPKVLTRKPGYHYGWDWGPRLVTSGIWKPVELRSRDNACIEDLHLVQESLSKERAVISAHFEIDSDIAQEAEVYIETPDPEKKKPRRLKEVEIDLVPGFNRVSFTFEIAKPRLWWTNGLGTPHLYSLTGTLEVDGDTVDSISKRIGLRTLEVMVKKDQTKAGNPGETFYIKLNGVPVFMKGANYIPQDNFLARVTDEQYRTVIGNAVKANMNMLRVWGGGFYEKDIFYDLCDEAGILVWQDFMFACAMYPGDNEFFENVRQEAIDNVKRLRSHACIALWCGNNEVDEAWHNWGWQEPFTEDQRARIWEDYQKIFHEILPAVVNRYDPGRFYWPSSPKFGRSNYRSLSEGDNHYWGVWHEAEPFAVFNEKIGRFMSEHGFQAFPPLETVKSFTLPEDRTYDSAVMMVHQKHPRGNQLINTYMERDYHVPQDFELFVYLSQVLQAEGMKVAMEAHRRAIPHCMGSLYWQLNDCWPVVSWSGIDYYGRWKALHYFAKKAYAPVMVSPVIEDGKFTAYLVSDRLEPVKGVLYVQLMDLAGKQLWQQEVPVTAEANSSRPVFEIETEKLTANLDKKNLVAVTDFKKENTILASNIFYFVPPKELSLTDPAIRPVISENTAKRTVDITLTCKSLAKNVYLSVEGIPGSFSDNFFDLLPGKAITVRFTADQDLKDFHKKLKIISLKDTTTPSGNVARAPY
jgi:beta-mannosidase